MTTPKKEVSANVEFFVSLFFFTSAGIFLGMCVGALACLGDEHSYSPMMHPWCMTAAASLSYSVMAIFVLTGDVRLPTLPTLPRRKPQPIPTARTVKDDDHG